MRSMRSAVLVLAGFLLLLPAPLRAQKLDDDDKKFLTDVHPIILPAEKATYEKLKDKADRLEFQKIFWARRDPDLATPENEFQQQYLKDRATADESYRAGDQRPAPPPTAAAPSSCSASPTRSGAGRRRVRWRSEGGVRAPEVWVYRDAPTATSRAARRWSRSTPSAAPTATSPSSSAAWPPPRSSTRRSTTRSTRTATSLKLADQLPRNTQIRALIGQPRQEFPLAFQPAYLKVGERRDRAAGAGRGRRGRPGRRGQRRLQDGRTSRSPPARSRPTVRRPAGPSRP